MYVLILIILCIFFITGRQTNPEDVQGIKEAITILENQDKPNSEQSSNNGPNGIQVVTPLPKLDERNNHRTETENSPVYRATRNYNSNSTRKNAPKENSQESSSEYRLITVNAGMNVDKNQRPKSEDRTKTSAESSERKHRRRMTLKNTPTSTSTTTTTTTTTPKPTEAPIVEIIKQEIQPIESYTAAYAQQQRLTDELDSSFQVDSAFLREAANAPPVKRFYRSSAEKDSKEVTFINNEKVQIVRPTSMAKLVGDYQTPTAAIAKLDEAILGRTYSSRVKKSAVTIVTPQNHENYQIPKDQT